MNPTRKKPVNILIIEDDPDILNALNIVFGSLGFDVDVLMNGTAILRNQFVKPDLFIIDKRLPDIDGLEICRFLKSKILYSDIPIIVISASEKTEEEAIRAGAACFIEKPFVVQHLVNTIQDMLAHKV